MKAAMTMKAMNAMMATQATHGRRRSGLEFSVSFNRRGAPRLTVEGARDKRHARPTGAAWLKNIVDDDDDDTKTTTRRPPREMLQLQAGAAAAAARWTRRATIHEGQGKTQGQRLTGCRLLHFRE